MAVSALIVTRRPAKILLVAGARPNFMKIAPVMFAMDRRNAEAAASPGVPGHAPLEFRPVLVHTGQHYDAGMSDVFFSELGLPAPDHHLGVGSGTHAEQTAKVMVAFERVLAR